MSLLYIFQGGRIKDNLTSVTLVNNVQKVIDLTVPVGKRWILQFAKMNNSDNVNRTCRMKLWKEVAKTNLLAVLFAIANVTASADAYYPFSKDATTQENILIPLVLENPMTLEFTWEAGGASAGATDADGLVAMVLEMDM